MPPISLFKERCDISQFLVACEIHDAIKDVIGHEVLRPKEIVARKFGFHLNGAPVVEAILELEIIITHLIVLKFELAFTAWWFGRCRWWR